MNGMSFCRRPWIRLGALLSLVVLVSLSTVTEGQQGGAKWEVLNNKATGNFIVALAQDLQGNIWVGTEDKGVFRYDAKAPDGKQWTQFNSKNGLGDDNAYAIACDKLGRVWVGTLNKGVSVYNGKDWKNYDVLDGLIGERIFAVTACPTDGDVWMATSAGLTHYSLKNDNWHYYTRSDGLPEDQANALAFDPQGNIYVGTQCHGIAMAKATEEYKKWTVVAGPAQLLVTPSGTGLPTSLINALLVGQNGTIYAGTSAGLAWSKDKGKTWGYLRGRDYDDKVKGRWGGPPAGWKAAPKQVMDTLLPEDYVTCLSEDAAGLVWLGFRQQGYLALDTKTNRPVFQGNKKSEGLPDDYVFAILPRGDFRPWIGSYGGGVAQAKQPFKGAGAKGDSGGTVKPPDQLPSLPAPAKPPTLAELKQIVDDLKKLSSAKPLATQAGVSLPDDWRTQGNFYGADKLKNYRYGEWHAHLCAFCSPFDAVWGRKGVAMAGKLGLNRTKDDSLRHWVHWNETENVRSLKNPYMGGRRQSEWDDHGEAYPMSHEGPHLYVTVHMPPGSFYLSFYNFNKDGHEGSNRFRDYLITVKQYCETDAEFARAPVIAQGRFLQFWGGVYKVFAVKGGQKYSVQIHDNWSFNTILAGVFVDPIFDPREERPYMVDVPRVRYSFTPEGTDDLSKFASQQASSPHHQALGLMGGRQQLRASTPLAFVRDARRTELGIQRVLANNLPKEVAKEAVQRIQAECLNQLRLFEDRDAIYQELGKR